MAENAVAETGEVSCFVLEPGTDRSRPCSLQEAMTAIDRPDARIWINLQAPTPESLAPIAEKLQLHELAVEDIFNPQSQSKIESYAAQLFCVVPALNLGTKDDLFDVVNLNAFLGRNYLLSTQRAPLAGVAAAGRWLASEADPLQRGVDFVFYQILDVIVDEYVDLTDYMTDQIDGLEEQIFGTPDKSVSEKIFDLRRKAAWLRRMIAPQREILNVLTNRPLEFVSRDTQLYLRDVYDHVQRVRENAEIFHDLLQGAMETYLTLVANRTNDVMRLLAVIGTVVLPINMLTGLYGTNFEVLPGSQNPIGFWVFVGALLLVAAMATVIFRSRKWF